MLINQVAILKTIVYNFRLFKFSDACKLPLILGKRTKVELKKGDIVLPEVVTTGLISFGIGGSADLYYFENRRNYLGVKNGGRIEFKGKAHFAVHTSCFSSGGILTFGDKFSSNVGCKISTVESIEFGNECLLGGDVVVRDSDGHVVYDLPQNEDSHVHESEKAVNIGNHVWIGNKASILKGVTIGDGCIVGYGAILTKSVDEKNCLIGGIPGRILKRNVSWKR